MTHLAETARCTSPMTSRTLAQWHTARLADLAPTTTSIVLDAIDLAGVPRASDAALPQVGRRPRLHPGATMLRRALRLPGRDPRHRRRAGRHAATDAAHRLRRSRAARATRTRGRRARAGLLQRLLPRRRAATAPHFARSGLRGRAHERHFLHRWPGLSRCAVRPRDCTPSRRPTTPPRWPPRRRCCNAAAAEPRHARAGHQPGRGGHGVTDLIDALPAADRVLALETGALHAETAGAARNAPRRTTRADPSRCTARCTRP